MSDLRDLRDLNIRGVPVDLLRKARSRAALLGKTLKQWVMDIITREVAK